MHRLQGLRMLTTGLFLYGITTVFQKVMKEGSGSVVGCLTPDQGVANSSLPEALCP